MNELTLQKVKELREKYGHVNYSAEIIDFLIAQLEEAQRQRDEMLEVIALDHARTTPDIQCICMYCEDYRNEDEGARGGK